MLETYKATLKGNQIEWKDAPPANLPHEIAVHVTLLTETRRVSDGKGMAEAMEMLAQLGGSSIADPLAWEREMREDRPLPGRDE